MLGKLKGETGSRGKSQDETGNRGMKQVSLHKLNKYLKSLNLLLGKPEAQTGSRGKSTAETELYECAIVQIYG